MDGHGHDSPVSNNGRGLKPPERPFIDAIEERIRPLAITGVD